MSTSTLAGHVVTRARVHLPAWGIPWVEATLDEDATLTGPAKFVLADLEMTGTIMSGGPGPKGSARYRLAAGAGFWGKTIEAKSYANDAGVKASLVIEDAARACGETVDSATMPSTRLGPAYAREMAPAARVLELIFPSGWYVGEDGVTRIGKRPLAALPSDVQIAAIDRAMGTVELAADSIAALRPGVKIEDLEAVDVMHTLEPGSIRTTMWTAGIAPTDRLLSSLRRIVEQLDPRRRYRGIFEYRVVFQQDERLDLQPIRVSIGMPTLSRVFVRPGIPGARAEHKLGSRVMVAFLDAEPSRPVVVGFEDAEGDGFLPRVLELDAVQELDLGESALVTKLANGTMLQGVARQNDPVIAGPFSGKIVLGSTKVRCG